MISRNVSLLFDIEDHYDLIRRNVETIRIVQDMIGTDLNAASWALHVTHLCEKDIEVEMKGMKAAIDKLRQGLEQPPESPLPPPVNPPIA
jgi:hypothetical protein